MCPLLPTAANSEGNKETMDDRSPIPAGDYLVHIVKTEFKQTKAKTGHYLSVQFKVLEGDCKGRVLFTNLNLDNPNSVAVEIANKELNSICQACGLEGVEDSDELLQIPMVASVKIKAADANWPASNEIGSYASADTPMAESSETGPLGAEKEAEEGKGELPWEEK